MKTAYPKKLRFMDAPIAEHLIPADCRDDYGIDAVKLTRHLAAMVERLAGHLAFQTEAFSAEDFIREAMPEGKNELP